jgi:hypothetical protein
MVEQSKHVMDAVGMTLGTLHVAVYVLCCRHGSLFAPCSEFCPQTPVYPDVTHTARSCTCP